MTVFINSDVADMVQDTIVSTGVVGSIKVVLVIKMKTVFCMMELSYSYECKKLIWIIYAFLTLEKNRGLKWKKL